MAVHCDTPKYCSPLQSPGWSKTPHTWRWGGGKGPSPSLRLEAMCAEDGLRLRPRVIILGCLDMCLSSIYLSFVYICVLLGGLGQWTEKLGFIYFFESKRFGSKNRLSFTVLVMLLKYWSKQCQNNRTLFTRAPFQKKVDSSFGKTATANLVLVSSIGPTWTNKTNFYHPVKLNSVDNDASRIFLSERNIYFWLLPFV